MHNNVTINRTIEPSKLSDFYTTFNNGFENNYTSHV